MVLAQLGESISQAIHEMSNATIVDEKVLNDCLNEIARALLQADVQFKLVRDMVSNVKKKVNLNNLAAGLNKRKIIEKAIVNELCEMLDTGKPFFTPQKGKTNVVMFVGLQGSGKTTTCTKYAYYHQKKGWRPALVCADTFRAGAFDQLKQNATKAKIPYYGSHLESDPVKIAVEGVERFKKENHDLIIVDTSGRHKQEAALFEEMRQVFEATKPDLVIFVMDSSIGQAAFDQAQAFKQSVSVGAVVVTKMDGHAKGGGALIVAATKSPVIFIGTGEHMDQFEVFDAKQFILRLLGKGDLSGLLDKIEAVDMDQQAELLQQLYHKENITFGLYQYILKMGYQVCNVTSHLPFLLGKSKELAPEGQEKEILAKNKRYIIMMDSMTNEELNCSNPKLINGSRIMRIARGAGCPVGEVMEMLKKYKDIANELSVRLRNMKKQNPRRSDGMGAMLNWMKQLGSSKDMMGIFGGRNK
ncbi:hypothetical protein L1049_019180 [Liquidambar formosana]|uniref:Signal recognition particle 54 kDa protein n=1 Tax=Liquidambar formosana TaxID=63359 RepID=A0AAP0RC68_LIQFO